MIDNNEKTKMQPNTTSFVSDDISRRKMCTLSQNERKSNSELLFIEQRIKRNKLITFYIKEFEMLGTIMIWTFALFYVREHLNKILILIYTIIVSLYTIISSWRNISEFVLDAHERKTSNNKQQSKEGNQ